jgi:hypothetical protein
MFFLNFAMKNPRCDRATGVMYPFPQMEDFSMGVEKSD